MGLIEEIEKCINEYHDDLSQAIISRTYSYPNIDNIQICIHYELPNRSIFPTSILSLPVLERPFRCILPPNYSSLKRYYNNNSDHNFSLSETWLNPNIHLKQESLDFDRNFLKKMKIRLDNNKIVKIFPVQNIFLYPGIIINIDEKIVEEAQFIARIISEIISEIVTNFRDTNYDNKNKFLNLYLETDEKFNLEQIKEQVRSFNRIIFINDVDNRDININIHYKLAAHNRFYSLDQNTEECDPPRYPYDRHSREPDQYYDFDRRRNLKMKFKINKYNDDIEVWLN